MRKFARRRGAYLMMALFFTVLATTASLILINVMPSGAASLRLVRRDVESNQAAEAGVRDCMAWISHQLKNNVEPLTTPSVTRTGSIGRYSWSAVVTADAQTPPHPSSGLRMYNVQSTAFIDSQPKRKINCWLQAGTNFSKYAAFVETSPPPSFASFTLYQNQRTVDGLFRTNGILRLRINGSYWGPPVTESSFNALISASSTAATPDGIDYLSTSPSTASQYFKMNSLGRSGFLTGTSPLTTPPSSQPYANAGWGGTAPPSIPAGVTVNPAGGVCIGGQVDGIVLSVDPGSNPVVTITQGAVVTKVTRVTDSPVGGAPVGSRLVTVGTVSTIVPGLGSGVVYASGDILKLNGVNKGATTIATDFTTGKSIEIVGDLTRADTALGARPTSNRDPLGLVGEQVRVTDDTSLVPRNASSTLRIYANIFAHDHFLVEQPYNTALGTGKMEVFGSLIGVNSWESSLSSPPLAVTIAGLGNPSGHGSFKLVSDPNADFYPPPHFPASEAGQMEIRYWKESPL